MRRLVGTWAVAALLSGCAAPPVFKHTTGAPRLPPVANTEVVDRPPVGAILLGTAEVQTSVYQTREDCDEAVLIAVKRAGATHVVMRGGLAARSNKGPSCRAEAYYLPSKR
jgi:hypothetical protein